MASCNRLLKEKIVDRLCRLRWLLYSSLLACLVLALAGCISAANPTLPYEKVPQLTLAANVHLVASPVHPTSYLPFEPVEAGTRVSLIGADENAAWLLVMHDDLLGWMPTVYSASNVGGLVPPLTFELPSNSCAKYVGTLTTLNAPWISPQDGGVTIVGSVVVGMPDADFVDAILSIDHDESVNVLTSDYANIRLTDDMVLVFFTYAIASLERGDLIAFELSQESGTTFQAAIFADSCLTDPSHLTVGKARLPKTKYAGNGADRIDGGVRGRKTDATEASNNLAEPTQIIVADDASFFDEFDGPELAEGWRWLREDSRGWNLDDVDGYLRIMSHKGDMAVDCRTIGNVLLYDAPAGNFAIQTKLSISPHQNYQQGGLVIFDDQDNYIKLDLVWSDSIIKNPRTGIIGIELLAEQNGEFPEWPWPISTLRPGAEDVLLRLAKNGYWFDGAYSVDGRRWMRLGSVEAPNIRGSEVGLMTTTGIDLGDCRSTAPPIPVDFDYFYLDAKSDLVAPNVTD